MISQFQGAYRWLSNFAPVTIVFNNLHFPSVEHAYMSEKSHDPAWKQTCMHTSSPGMIKKMSRSVLLRSDWHKLKLQIMSDAVTQKFNQEPYTSLLKATGDEHIQEGNYWNDKFWGVCLKTGVGENHLGKLIMQIRETL